MLSPAGIFRSFNVSRQRLIETIARQWRNVRAFLDGLRIAWVSAASVLLAFWLFTFAPQAQDLFLEVRGSLPIGTLFWLGFYAAIIVVWVFPVYVCSHWILYKCRNEGLSPYENAGVADWVCRLVPRVLAVACLAAVLLGQLFALSNTPTIFDEVSQARADDLKKVFEQACSPEGVTLSPQQTALCYLKNIDPVSRYLLIELSKNAGAENMIFIIYGAIVALPAFFLLTYLWIRISESTSRRLRIAFAVIGGWLIFGILVNWYVVPYSWGWPQTWPWVPLHFLIWLATWPFSTMGELSLLLIWSFLPAALRKIPIKWLRNIPLGLWWLVTGLCAFVFAAVLVVSIYGLVRNELEDPLGIGHLALLPVITLLLGWLVWWALGPNDWGKPTRVERLLPWRASSTIQLFDDARVRAETWSPLFKAIVIVSLVLLAYQLSLHPVEVTRHVYRALMVPFFLGLLVPILTFVSHFSFRVHAPITAMSIIAIAIAISMRTGVHDVRGVERQVLRPTLEETVERWATANNCDLKTAEVDRICPQPIIVSAAGGASRAAFLVGAVVGRLMDETNGSSANGIRPFQKQLFAISGVSGGALGAAVTYAALADSQLGTANKSKGTPPCIETARDTEWFAQRPDRHTSWRSCLELIMSGDFLSPVFVGLISNDIFGTPFRSDRAGILENAWERRYAHLTGQSFEDPANPTMLDRSIVGIRRQVLDADPSNWLPVLLLNGTSVTTGRRIIASDVDTLYSRLSTQVLAPRGRLFRDSYDLHELFQTPRFGFERIIPSRNGRTMLALVQGIVQIWEVATESEHVTIGPVPEGGFNTASLSPDGRKVLATPSGKTLGVWDAETGTLLHTLERPDEETLEGIEFAPDGTRALTWSWNNAQLLDVERGRELCRFTSDSGFISARLSPDGGLILAKGELGDLRLWNTDNCAVVQTFDTSSLDFSPSSAAISPDGRRIVTAINYSGEVLIWDTGSGAIEHKLEMPITDEHEFFRNTAFSPDGKLVVAQTYGKAVIWRAEDGARIREFKFESSLHSVQATFSPNGQRLLILSDNAAQIHDVETWELIRSFRGQEGVIEGATFYQDGERILTWDDNGVVHLWDIDVGAEIGLMRVSRSSLAQCANCDVRLSTAVTMSARFPVISPPGSIRNAADKIIDRVVDGGYYENFGAITALELAEVLRNRYNLSPAVILVNNEPSVRGMSCITPDSRLAYPDAPYTLSFATFRSSVEAMMATRSARGTHAAVELCSRVTADNFAFVSVRPDPTNPRKALTMSWWLSKHVQKYLDDQVSATAKTLNSQAFEKIAGWQKR